MAANPIGTISAILIYQSHPPAIGTILVVFYLQVTLMLLTKFRVSWPFGSGEEAKNRFSTISIMVPCPYMVKTFKNPLLQNRECLGAESLHKSSGTGVSKMVKIIFAH